MSEFSDDESRWVVRWLWIYFALLILEGVLRKWIIPQLSDVLLLSRDPVVIAIYMAAIRANSFPKNAWLSSLYLISGVSLFVSLVTAGAPILVYVFGLRTNLLHVPLIFIMASHLRHQDVNRFGAALLLIAAPMAILMTLQFASPPDAWLNRGAISVGGSGGQIDAGFGRIRPAGPFSFTTGVSQYWTLTTGFLLSGFLKKTYPKWLLTLAAGSLLLGLVVSGARYMIISCGLVAFAYCLVALRPEHLIRAVGVACVVVLLAVGVSKLGIFELGMESLVFRFTEGGGLKEGIVDRSLKEFTSAFQYTTWSGVGLGLGTNVGAKLATGQVDFLVAEGEWGRVLGESGIIVGLALLLWRLGLVVFLLWRALAICKVSPLALFLWVGCGELILQGQWGQATSLGFAIFGGGLCLAATQPATERIDLDEKPVADNQPNRLPGRSAYARALHGE